MANYTPLDISFVSGQGAYLYDTKGRAYLDALSGIAVCGLGHAHPVLAEIIAEQASKLIHTSNYYRIKNQELLAERLVKKANMDRVFFANSGAEVNEAAIKLARLYGHKKGINTPRIIAMQGGFHGRTLGALAATANPNLRKGFGPDLQGFDYLPYNDSDAVRERLEQDESIVAIMLEPILGEGGIVIPEQGYLQQLRKLCDQYSVLLILDEIQTGMGRTGLWFACQHEEVRPDIMTLAKSLGNGFPIGACLAQSGVADLFQSGAHGSTFGGNPLGTSIALGVIDLIAEQGLIETAKALGEKMLNAFKERLENCLEVQSIRGKGLMLGIELRNECMNLPQIALERGLLINVTAKKVIRLLPPLIISPEEANQIVEGVCDLIYQVNKS